MQPRRSDAFDPCEYAGHALVQLAQGEPVDPPLTEWQRARLVKMGFLGAHSGGLTRRGRELAEDIFAEEQYLALVEQARRQRPETINGYEEHNSARKMSRAVPRIGSADEQDRRARIPEPKLFDDYE